jgi:uncharacterized membrane protein YtjA (UPF0391 family)
VRGGRNKTAPSPVEINEAHRRTIARRLRRRNSKEMDMLGWALTFLVVAIIAAFFGFGGIAVASAGIAKLLFFVFLVLFAVTLLAGLIRGRPLA